MPNRFHWEDMEHVSRLTKSLAGLRDETRDPTRPVMINFGQGVANEFWRGRGACNGNQTYYDLRYRVPISYRMTSIPWARRPLRLKVGWNSARGVTNLLKRANDGQSVWMALETTALDQLVGQQRRKFGRSGWL